MALCAVEYERPFVQPPLESLKMILRRSRVAIERELSTIVARLDRGNYNRQESLARLGVLEAKLSDLKREYEEVSSALVLRSWLLATLHEPASADLYLTVLLTEHLATEQHDGAVDELIRRIPGLEKMIDRDLIRQQAELVHDVAVNCNFERGLAWCRENRSFLAKQSPSDLEFDLHLLQYLKLAESGDVIAAVKYARANLAGMSPVHNAVLVKAAGALIQMPEGQGPQLYFEGVEVEAELSNAFMAIHGRSMRHSLSNRLGLGIAALKTRLCGHPDHLVNECPLCSSSSFTQLAAGVPYANHSKSILDSDMLALPNGHVIAKDKLQMTLNGKCVIDPVSRQTFDTELCVKVFPL